MGTPDEMTAARSTHSSGWVTRLAPHLIRLAALNAPAAVSSRLEEEWLADLSQRQSQISRLRLALGCYWAARVIQHDHCSAPLALPTVALTKDKTMMASARTGVAFLRRRPASISANNVLCDMNITPLIDVMLVLLITLIFSLPMMTHAVKIDMPRPPTAQPKTPPDVIDLDIDFDGTLVWNGNVLSGLGQLEGYLRAEARKDPQPEIHLRPDRRVKYESVAKVLALAQHNRMQRVGFVNTGDFKN